jgi:hypothetical protein
VENIIERYKTIKKEHQINAEIRDREVRLIGEMGEQLGIDDDIHLGIKAQDLEKSPVTESIVSEDVNGNKVIDTKELTAANTAVISEICKRLEVIEKILGIEVM